MKTLVAFYSLDGHIREIAKETASALDADTFEIVPKRPIKAQSMGAKIFKASLIMIFRRKPPIEPCDKDIDSYDRIIIGTPVWMGTFVPYLKTFLAKNQIKNKKVNFIISCGGEAGKAEENLKKMAGDNDFGETLILTDKQEDIAARKRAIVEFIGKLKT